MGARFAKNPMRAMIATGHYTGNGADDRNIDIGVNLLTKYNVLIIIKKYTGNSKAVFRMKSGGDETFYFDTTAQSADRIQAFTDTGFQIGSDAEVNENTKEFYYAVIYSLPY